MVLTFTFLISSIPNKVHFDAMGSSFALVCDDYAQNKYIERPLVEDQV